MEPTVEDWWKHVPMRQKCNITTALLDELHNAIKNRKLDPKYITQQQFSKLTGITGVATYNKLLPARPNKIYGDFLEFDV